MTVLPFRPKPRAPDTEVIVAALEVISRFIDEGGDEEGDSDTEAFIRALREEIRSLRAIKADLQLRFNFDPDHAS
jgi:hypothetical protein